MLPTPIKGLRTFVAAKDFQQSRNFYKALGFEETYLADDHSLAVFSIGRFSFYLQDFYVKDWAENSMLFLEVEDVEAWWNFIQQLNLKEQFSNIKLIPPRTEPWGKEMMLIDPTGVLWHIGQFKKE